MFDSVHSRALNVAAEKIGGFAELRRFLHVPSADLLRWITGEEPVPMAVFLQVVDVVLDGITPDEQGPAAHVARARLRPPDGAPKPARTS